MPAYPFAPVTIESNPIPLSQVAPWAILGGLMMLMTLYFVGAEQGATSLVAGSQVHEFVHDSRHMFGFPCH